MLLRQLIFYALSLIYLSSCSSIAVNLDPNERIMIYGDFMSKTYQQKGEALNRGGLQTSLGGLESSQSLAKKSRWWSSLVWPSVIAGGALGIASITDNGVSSSERDARLGISLGLVGLALLANYNAQNNLDDAVDKFNEKFPPLPPPKPTEEVDDIDTDASPEPSK